MSNNQKLNMFCDQRVDSSKDEMNASNDCDKRIDRNNMALMWQHLTYYSKSLDCTAKSSRIILRQLKGFIRFGTITALMGASGAGKTTLLRCVNGMNTSGLTCDSLLCMSASKHISKCFIVQNINEHLLMSLTVRQSLRYASLLKNRGKYKLTEENAGNLNVENLVEELMLDKCVDTRVSECSGGEQKRLVIAMELTAQIKPNLICIDEPTSGLDSYAAEQTVCCLQTIARKHNIAIVTSIHQPNSDVLMMFDMLYVLSICGECVYFGSPLSLRHHLTECDIQCTQYQSPIQVLLQVSSNNTKNKNTTFGLSDQLSCLINKTSEFMDSLNFDSIADKMKTINGLHDTRKSFNFVDMWYLIERTAIYSWISQWKMNAFLLMLFITFSVFISKLYSPNIGQDSRCFNVEHTNASNCMAISARHSPFEQNILFLYLFANFITFLYLTIPAMLFPSEINIFFNEHRNGWYSTGSYYWAKTLIELPLLLINTFIYCWIGYYLTSQPQMNHWYNALFNTSDRFSLFVFVITSFVLIVQSVAIFTSILFPKTPHFNQLLSVAIFIATMPFTGILIPLQNFPDFVQSISNFSFFKIAIHLNLIVIYGRDRCESGLPIALVKFNIDERDYWSYIYCFVAHLLFWRLIALFILILKANPVWLSKLQFKSNKSKNHSKLYTKNHTEMSPML